MQMQEHTRNNQPSGPQQGHNVHPRYEQLLAENAELKKKMQQERGMRQYYAKKLEDAEEEWLEQVEQLQSYVKSIRNTMRDMNQTKDTVTQGRSSSESADRKSPNRMNGASPERPGSSPGSHQQRDKRYQVVRDLKGAFEAKTSVLEDDVAFIQEVKEGISLAPEMDPERELQDLIKKFRLWKSDFKEKLKSTNENLKKLNKELAPPQGRNSRGTVQSMKRGQSPGSHSSLDTGGTESGSQGSGKKGRNKNRGGVVRRFLSLGRASH